MVEDENEAWLESEEVGSLGTRQYRLWNEENTLLMKALEAGDIPKARASWSVLAKEHLLRFFGPPHHSQYSRLLAVIQNRNPKNDALSQEDTETMEEMMLVAAVGGYLDGLRARMLYLARKRDADAILRLYHRYAEMMEATGFLSSEPEQEQDEEAELEGSEEGEEQILGLLPAGPSRYIRGEVLLFAIVAYAMKDSFSDALRLGIKTPAMIHIPSFEEALSPAHLKPPVYERVSTYLRRIRLAKLLARPQALQRHLNNLVRSRANKQLERLYSDLMTTLRDPQSGVVLDASAVSQDSPILFSETAWSAFLATFLQCRQLNLAESLWDDMEKLGVKHGPDVWAALLEGYGGLRLIDQARAAWSVMIKQRDARTAVTYKAMIIAEFRSGHPDEALKRFDEFKEYVAKGKLSAEQTETVFVYNTVLSWLLKLSQSATADAVREKQAMELVQRMLAKGPAPDVVTFNTLLRYHANQGDLKSLAAVIRDMSQAEITGDVYTYSTVLVALAPVRQDATRVVLDMMKKHGIQPNTAMYTTIITSLMRQNTEVAFRSALDLLNVMEASDSDNMQPNIVTYTAILAAIHRRSWLDPLTVEETTRLITEKMTKRNFLYSRVTYNILIKACLDNPSPSGLTDALRYYREMVARKVYIDADTWYILLNGLLRKREFGMANEFVDEILNRGYAPTQSLRVLMRRVRQLYEKNDPSLHTEDE
ncbi:hypothetical protein EIP86_010479 [Pleurotus ostreatoroseus]|nr:hypothetical protein EIP86_010479 [Pleurotus ostreatoroseus]